MFLTSMTRPLGVKVAYFTLVMRVMRGSARTAAPRRIRSWADDTWPVSSRPFGFSKFVLVIPSSAARWFISSTKASTEPATCSARATAAPLSE